MATKLSKTSKKDPQTLIIGGVSIARGERKRVLIESFELYDSTRVEIPVEVIRGKLKGPVLFISAAVHGDEVNGVEIIRRILKKKNLTKIKGTLILIPVVNVLGFNSNSRYLPDRRDLNRSFPGSKNGSMAGRIANVFMKEIVSKCTHGIDLHTGAIHRTNLPQIRACLDNPDTKMLAEGFGVPVVINSALRDGSLREAARKKKVSMLLFEGGEALRFEEQVIVKGVRGCMSVMHKVGMLPKPKAKTAKSADPSKIYIAKSSYWVRAQQSGILSMKKKIGEKVKVGDVLAVISDNFGKKTCSLICDTNGILIGALKLPMVHEGDAIFHIATFSNVSRVERALELHDDLDN